jgi:Dolichyl-phosphate-mannose-protein mannosyltransferase
MARALRRADLTVALAALVGVSTLLHWLAGRRLPGLWIMPDEAIYASRAITLWRHASLPLLHGKQAGYGILYPLVAGLPLSVGDIPSGYSLLKFLQALVMSLTAVPVFVYGRRLMPAAYALLAATLALASPLLLYSGLVMTEVLFYPLVTLALLATARAVSTASGRDQAVALGLVVLAVATRLQAVALVPAFAAALVLDAALGRTPSRLRRFWPVWIVVALVAVVTLVAPGALGAYAATVQGGYPFGTALGLTYDHLALVAVMVAVVPAASGLLMLVNAARGCETDAHVRALIAVTWSTIAVLVVQVGFFAARFAPHLLGRNLAAVPPLLFLLFTLWLARGAPRARAVASASVLLVLACIAFAPWDKLVSNDALPNTFDVAIFQWADWARAADVAAIGAAFLLAVFVFVPRRVVLLLPALVLALLVLSSVVASNRVAARVRADQAQLVGSPQDWVDRATRSRVAYVYNDQPSWNVVWQQRFWNRRITDVVSLAPVSVPGPMHQERINPGPMGELPTDDAYVVASSRDTFVGTPVAQQSLGPNSFALTLWQLIRPARLASVVSDVAPNGDIQGDANVVAYDCGGGRLLLTLLPKSTEVVDVYLDGNPVLRRFISGLPSWSGEIPVPPSSSPRSCHFTIRGGALLGSTVIRFEHA